MTEENLIFTPDIVNKRNESFSIDGAVSLYSLSLEELLKCGFKKIVSPGDYGTNKLYLFPKLIYNLIPDGFIVQEINYTGRWKNKLQTCFKPFKYEENYFDTHETYKTYETETISTYRFTNKLISEHLYIGINIAYTYNELLIKTIIE